MYIIIFVKCITLRDNIQHGSAKEIVKILLPISLNNFNRYT